MALNDLRGKVVVLHFVYTNCPDVCPLHAERIAEVQEMVNRTPMRELVQFVTITTDPEHDTPEVMREYGSAHGLNPVNWRFLTSGPDWPEDTTRNARRTVRAHVHPDRGGLPDPRCGDPRHRPQGSLAGKLSRPRVRADQSRPLHQRPNSPARRKAAFEPDLVGQDRQPVLSDGRPSILLRRTFGATGSGQGRAC